MTVEFCPICGDILELVPMNIGGVMYDFWVCPAGDWEDPANVEAEQALAQSKSAPEKS